MRITNFICRLPSLLEFFNKRIISSAVSTVLRSQEFPFADAAGAEHCGYGDLR
jgi:hypothetical protein